MDGGAWWATVHRVAKSWTWLSDFTQGFPGSSLGKESACNAGDPGLTPELGRSTGEGISFPLKYSWASLVAQLVKNPPATWVDLGLIPGLGRSPGEENSYPLQNSGLENSRDCVVNGVTESRTWLSDFHFHSVKKQPKWFCCYNFCIK